MDRERDLLASHGDEAVLFSPLESLSDIAKESLVDLSSVEYDEPGPSQKITRERSSSVNRSGNTLELQNLQPNISFNALNFKKDQIMEKIMDFVETQIGELQEGYKTQTSFLVGERNELLQQSRKLQRETRKLCERNERLSKQLVMIHGENTSLRETITQLESAMARNSDVSGIFNDIKEKLWENTVSISSEKKKRISLLVQLSHTRFKTNNEKHVALLNKLWSLHYQTPGPTDPEQWTLLGFETSTPNYELEKTGILGLQNLVYFSERYCAVAKKIAKNESYKWAKCGLLITSLLMSLLRFGQEQGSASEFPNKMFQTFIKLMDHPKAFEELYCICFMIFDQTPGSANERHDSVKSKLKELLLADPKDLMELMQMARNV